MSADGSDLDRVVMIQRFDPNSVDEYVETHNVPHSVIRMGVVGSVGKGDRGITLPNQFAHPISLLECRFEAFVRVVEDFALDAGDRRGIRRLRSAVLNEF
nr:hypothetical protein [Halovivax sp. KZCA124]